MLRPYLEEILSTISKESSAYALSQGILKKVQDIQPISKDYLTEKSLYKEFI